MKKNKIISTVMAVTMLCTISPVSQTNAEENQNIIETDRYICEYLGTELSDKNENKVDVGEGRYIVTDSETKTSQLVDEQGNVLRDVTGYRFDTVLGYGSEYSDGLLLLKFFNKTETDRKNYYICDDIYEYIDIDGNTAFTYTDTYEKYISGGGAGGGFAVSGFWSGTENEIYYAENLKAFHNGYAAFYNTENKSYGFFDKQGNVITKELYNNVYPFAGNFAIVGKKIDSEDSTYKCGIIDTNGDYVLPCEYSYIDVASITEENWFTTTKYNNDSFIETLYHITKDGKAKEIYSVTSENLNDPHILFYAGNGICGDCIGIPDIIQYSYFYDMETKERIIPDLCLNFNDYLAPLFTEEWNHFYTRVGTDNDNLSANFYNSKGEKILDTDSAVMQWDKNKDYFVLRDANEDNNYSYKIVDKSMNTIVENGIYIADDRFIAEDENGFYSASFKSPDNKTKLPYDNISTPHFAYGPFQAGNHNYRDSDIYNDIFVVSDTPDSENLYTPVENIKLIDSTGKSLINEKYNFSDFNYETGIVSVYEEISDEETNTTSKIYHNYKLTPKIVSGDINNDSITDATDASAVLNIYSMISTGKNHDFTEKQLKSADVNNDGLIDATDSSLILMYYSYVSTGGTDSFDDFLLNKSN